MFPRKRAHRKGVERRTLRWRERTWYGKPKEKVRGVTECKRKGKRMNGKDEEKRHFGKGWGY